MYCYGDLLERAAECTRLATEVKDPSIREKLQQLARQFQDLADRARTLETIRVPKNSSWARIK
jgi:hypothetical protein